MNYTEFIAEYAGRLGIGSKDAKFLVEEFCEEILRQLVLGQDVRIARLGVFSSHRTKPTKRVSGLPSMQGKPADSRAKKRIKFRAFNNARQALNRNFMAVVSGGSALLGCGSPSLREGVSMAKKKQGEHVNIDLPEGVKQITINVASEEQKPKKKKKSGESSSSKRRLYG